MIIYLAGAIDKAKDNPALWTKELVKELFIAHNLLTTPEPLIIYSPYLAFPSNLSPLGMLSLDEYHAGRLLHMNMVAVTNSDLVLLYYQPEIETWGTPMEAFRAKESEIPILVWTANTYGLKLPSYLTACAGGIIHVGMKAVSEAAFNIPRLRPDNG
jgi:hypothetical protein